MFTGLLAPRFVSRPKNWLNQLSDKNKYQLLIDYFLNLSVDMHPQIPKNWYEILRDALYKAIQTENPELFLQLLININEISSNME